MEDEDALSQGPTTSGNQFHAVNRGLIDAALVLRDPASLHLLIFQVLRYALCVLSIRIKSEHSLRTVKGQILSLS